MAAQSPLSFFGGLLACQWLYASGTLPAWAFLIASAALPFGLSIFERSSLFKRWPNANPAAWIAARWIAPSAQSLENMAKRARDCVSSFENEQCPLK